MSNRRHWLRVLWRDIALPWVLAWDHLCWPWRVVRWHSDWLRHQQETLADQAAAIEQLERSVEVLEQMAGLVVTCSERRD